MSLEQSKKIVEAAGEIFHDVGTGECSCGTTFFSIDVALDHIVHFASPDLSLPKNRHLLVGYVEEICDTDEKQSIFGAKLFSLIVEYEKWRKGLYPLQSGFYFATAPNEAVMTALCRVIEETK